MRKQANAGTHLRSCTDGGSVAAKGEWLTGAVSTHSALTCPVCDTALCSKDIGRRTVTALLARSALASVATPSSAFERREIVWPAGAGVGRIVERLPRFSGGRVGALMGAGRVERTSTPPSSATPGAPQLEPPRAAHFLKRPLLARPSTQEDAWRSK